MSLTNRLSLFFLTGLALVLVGFSLTLYFLARMYLYAQFHDRLEGAMSALVAAVEVHPHDVQWEPLERRIIVGEDPAADQPRWVLHDLSGRLRDRSANLTPESSSSETGSWRVLARRMRAGNFTAEAVDNEFVASLAETSFGTAATVPLPKDRTFESEGLILSVARNEAPVLALLRRLAITLAGVSAAIWIVAALTGRWLCRRALQPITRMAASARSIRREPEAAQMLEVQATRDELEDLGQAFNELLADLRESLERQRRFAGDASHQLRTPLTGLLAPVDVALRHERSPAEYQRVLAIVRRRGGQLAQIIETLLFLARADGAQRLAAPERIDLNDWCKTWLDAWSEHPRWQDCAFRAASEPALTMTQPALLRQILDNLLDNACKYSAPGTPVGVSVETLSDQVSITVRDSGAGIAAEQQTQIFEPFCRAAAARWQGTSGVGLGLALVQRLVGILGGRIEVMSALGTGSSFRVVLPRDKAILPQPECQREAAATAQHGQGGQPSCSPA